MVLLLLFLLWSRDFQILCRFVIKIQYHMLCIFLHAWWGVAWGENLAEGKIERVMLSKQPLYLDATLQQGIWILSWEWQQRQILVKIGKSMLWLKPWQYIHSFVMQAFAMSIWGCRFVKGSVGSSLYPIIYSYGNTRRLYKLLLKCTTGNTLKKEHIAWIENDTVIKYRNKNGIVNLTLITEFNIITIRLCCPAVWHSFPWSLV